MVEEQGQVQQLQAQLVAVQAKLAKTEASKQRLKEHWALLKEKVINAHTLCDERDSLVKQLEVESTARAEAQERLKAAVEQKAAAERACRAATKEKQRLDQLLDASAAEKQTLEQKLAQSMQAANEAQQQHQAVVKQCNAAEAAMQDMQKQLSNLQHTVGQLQQQQVISRLSKLEQQWRQLLDRDHILTVDQQELNRVVRPPLQQLLQQQVEPRLLCVEQNISELQQQVQRGLSAAGAVCTAAGQQEQGRQLLQQQQLAVADDSDWKGLQKALHAVVAEQQQLRGAVSSMQQQLATLQCGAGTQSLAIASTVPSREASPAAAAGPAAPKHYVAEAARVAPADRTAAVQLPAFKGTGIPGPTAATGGSFGSGDQCTRGSSMFGTTMQHISGLSSYSYGDQASPSEASVQQQSQQQQQQFVSRKRTWQQQLQAVTLQLVQPSLPQCAHDANKQTSAAPNGPEQAHKPDGKKQHQQHAASAVSCDILAAASSSSSGDDEADEECQQSIKRHRPLQQQQQQPKCRRVQQQQYIGLDSALVSPQAAEQPDLMVHFQAVKDQQADAAALAQQVARLVVAGKLQLDDVVKASCSSFMSAAAADYDVGRLQQQLSEVSVQQQQEQEQQGMEQLGYVGWAAGQYRAAKVAAYQQRLAAYVEQLSDLLQQQQQQQTAGANSSAEMQQGCLGWAAAAPCWPRLLQDTTSSSCGWPQQATVAAAAAAASERSLLQQVIDKLMPPVYQACQAAASAASQQQQLQQQQQQQQVLLAHACAAAAAAARLCRVTGNKQELHCILVRLLLASQGLCQCQHNISTSSAADSTQGKKLDSCADSLVHCLACILAALAAWPEALELHASHVALAGSTPGKPSGVATAEYCGSSNEERLWQLAVLDPVLVAIWSRLYGLTQIAAAAAAREGAAGQSLMGGNAGEAAAGATGGVCHVGVLARALLLVLRSALRSSCNSRSGYSAPAVGGTSDGAGCLDGEQQPCIDQHCMLYLGLDDIFEPVKVLGLIFGLLKVLLQKQQPILPGSCVEASDASILACAGSLCVSVRLLHPVAGGQQLLGMMDELHAILVHTAGHAATAKVGAVVQQMLSPVLASRRP